MKLPIELTDQERELFVLFFVGMVLGFIGIAIAEAWVIAADQADRRRIREVLAEWFAELPRRSPEEPAIAVSTLPATQPSETKGVIVCQ